MVTDSTSPAPRFGVIPNGSESTTPASGSGVATGTSQLGHTTWTFCAGPVTTDYVEPGIDTVIVSTLADLSALRNPLENILGADLRAVSNTMDIVTGQALGDPLHVGLPVTGATEGPKVGDLNFTFANLEVVTVDGQTTATLYFGGGITVTSGKIELTSGRTINLVLEEPKLNFQPVSPDASTLRGGDPTVIQIGASFALDFKDLPKGASLNAKFSKDIGALLEQPAAKFAELADSMDGQMGDLNRDVAFGVAVDKVGITDVDLGNNKITLVVSQEWIDAKAVEGKSVLIAKFDDRGSPAPPPGDVTGTILSKGGLAFVTAEFTGDRGGLSVFVLAAMTLPPPVAAPLSPADALALVIAADDNLVGVWQFDPSGQNEAPDFGWLLYDPRPSFAAANNLKEIAKDSCYWINVYKDQAVILGGKERTLFVGWNPVVW